MTLKEITEQFRLLFHKLNNRGFTNQQIGKVILDTTLINKVSKGKDLGYIAIGKIVERNLSSERDKEKLDFIRNSDFGSIPINEILSTIIDESDSKNNKFYSTYKEFEIPVNEIIKALEKEGYIVEKKYEDTEFDSQEEKFLKFRKIIQISLKEFQNYLDREIKFAHVNRIFEESLNNMQILLYFNDPDEEDIVCDNKTLSELIVESNKVKFELLYNGIVDALTDPNILNVKHKKNVKIIDNVDKVLDELLNQIKINKEDYNTTPFQQITENLTEFNILD
jgi:hypothetical protein